MQLEKHFKILNNTWISEFMSWVNLTFLFFMNFILKHDPLPDVVLTKYNLSP